MKTGIFTHVSIRFVTTTIPACAVIIGVDVGIASAGSPTPTGTVDDRDVYYPGTEPLNPNDMRIVALGTGMPSVRPKHNS